MLVASVGHHFVHMQIRKIMSELYSRLALKYNGSLFNIGTDNSSPKLGVL